ncbi:MAG: histidine--tRNA ligase [Candidatus Saccharimonadales bacterium]
MNESDDSRTKPLSTQPYKGARDFYPQEKRLQKAVFGTIRQVVESYGYEEYDAPILEPLELFLAKTGEEIVSQQTYTFTDRGDRQVVIRPEMTPSVSRMVAAKRQELVYPLRWYSLPVNWRYERPQRGRLREFWQLNVDLFGVAGLSAEQEIIEVADAILQKFGASRSSYLIKLNSRQLVESVLNSQFGLNAQQTHDVIKLIDRLHKISQADFLAHAGQIMSSEQEAADLHKLLTCHQINDLPTRISESEAAGRLKTLLATLQAAGIANVEFDMSVMRGLDYYTDIVFEVFDADPQNNRSMFGGGRYDGLVGLFGVEPIPTIGFGMGDVTLQNFLESHQLLPQPQPEVDLWLIPLDGAKDGAQKLVRQLRQADIRVSVDISERKVDKQTKAAHKKGHRWVLFVGPQELVQAKFTLKDLESGDEEKLTAQELISRFRQV